MSSSELEDFAKLLIEHVRDAAIQACDGILEPDAHGAVAARWRKAAKESPEELISIVIPDCVDEVIFQLLTAIDQELLRLRFTATNGKEIELHENGELAGWFMMTEGWIAQHSRERFVDDFSDIN